MLNKKGQAEHAFESIFVSIAIIVGIIVLTMGHNYKEFSVDKAMQKISPDIIGIQSSDINFLGTDLKNILDLQVSNEYTFAELISNMPNSDSTFNGLLKKDLDIYSCDEQLLNILNAQLEPVFLEQWVILVYFDNNQIFSCTPLYNVYTHSDISTNMTIPSLDFNKNIEVFLEVYE